MSLTPEQRKLRIATATKWGLAAAAVIVVSPVVFLLVKGLIGLVIAGIIGLAVINFAPVISMKFANWKVKAIVAEAAANPIETLQNLITAKREAFKIFKTSVESAITAKMSFAQKCATFKKQYPERAPEFEKQLENMEQMVAQKVKALKEAEKMLDVAYHKLDEMKAYWDMSQAAQEANKAAGMDTGDLYERMKADTAVDAVYSSMNRAFAQLEVAAALSTSQSPTLALEKAEPGMVIEMPATLVKEPIRRVS